MTSNPATIRAWAETITSPSYGIGQPDKNPMFLENRFLKPMIFYQGLARARLGRSPEARQIFQKLADYGQAHLGDPITLDYFAVSLPTFLVFEEAPDQRHRIHCHYMAALGHLGLGHPAEAEREFEQVLAWEADHQGALLHRQFNWAHARVIGSNP